MLGNYIFGIAVALILALAVKPQIIAAFAQITALLPHAVVQ